MRIIAVTNQFPLPLDAGGPIRFYGLTRALAAAHDVHFLALSRRSTTAELVADLERALDSAVEVFQPSPVGGFARRWARALARGVPTYVRDQYSQELADRLGTLAPEADAVVFLDDYAAGYAPDIAGATRVVADKSNVLGWSIAAEPVPAGVRERLRHGLAVHLIRRFERRYVRLADAVFVTSEAESDRLERLYGRRADAIVPSAVDIPANASALDGARAVAWLGEHGYAPNVEGLVRFVEEGWEPLGRDGWRLLVAGRNPPEEVLALQRVPGVELVGFVDRLDDLFERVSAGVVPLWRGAGVKLKTLTFMAAGVPLAATPVALEGVEVESGRHCLVADEPAALASGLRRIIDDRHLAQDLAAEARRLVTESYTWETAGPPFVKAVESAARAG